MAGGAATATAAAAAACSSATCGGSEQWPERATEPEGKGRNVCWG